MPMATPEAQREYMRLWVARRRSEWFADKTCWRCGSTEALELDHIDPATKDAGMRRRHQGNGTIWSWSLERREAELAKCQVLCQSCHRWKTKGCGEAAGENHGNAVLTEEIVLKIRRLHATGEVTQRQLSVYYGVHYTTVNDLINRRTWTLI